MTLAGLRRAGTASTHTRCCHACRPAQCDWAQVAHLPALTSSRVGSIPVDEIDACMSASAAAVQAGLRR